MTFFASCWQLILSGFELPGFLEPALNPIKRFPFADHIIFSDEYLFGRFLCG